MSSRKEARCLVRNLVLAVLLTVLSSCVGSEPIDVPQGGLYRNEPVTYMAPRDRVWDATLAALREYGWDIKRLDKEHGNIVLLTSYVYNPSFGENRRVYVKPSSREVENSKIRAYLRRISYYEKTAPPTPLFVREKMKITLKSISPEATQVRIKYWIWPYYDSRVGYVGTVRSKGYVERKIFDHIGRLLEGEAPS